MAYIDLLFFKSYAPGSPIADTEFPLLAERASAVIDTLTQRRVKERGGLAAFSPDVQESIQQATAAQVETLYLYGGVDAASGGAINPSSITIGKFSYSRSNDKEWTGASINGIPLSGLIPGYLGWTGLMYSGVTVRGCRSCQ